MEPLRSPVLFKLKYGPGFVISRIVTHPSGCKNFLFNILKNEYYRVVIQMLQWDFVSWGDSRQDVLGL